MSLREFNREMLELWLGAYAGGYQAVNQLGGGDPPKKKRSVLPVNVVWLEASGDPAVMETNKMLSEIVLEEMPRYLPRTYSLFRWVYLRDESNPADSERWRTSDIDMDRLKFKMLESGIEWILNRVGEFPLAVPDPVNPRGFVEKSQKKQRIAKRVYWQNVGEYGDSKARAMAAKKSGYSLRHLRNLIPPQTK